MINDEIKEILERVKKHYVLDEIQDNLLLDYITNLQQELAKEKEEKDSWQRVAIRYFNSAEDYKLKYFNIREDYKSRIEKAVEYIKKHLEDKKYLNEIYTDEKVLNIVLDILNGRSDE